MIDLVDHAYDEDCRKTLTQNTEYFSHLIYKKLQFLRPLHKQLLDVYGKEYDTELWLIISNAAKSVRYETQGFRISMDNKNYQAASKKYKVNLNKTRMAKLLRLMDSNGDILYMKGYHFNVGNSELSCVILKKLGKMIDKAKAKSLAPSRVVEDLAFVEVKDTVKTTHKQEVFKNTRNMRGIKEHRIFVENWFNLINSAPITIDGKVENCIPLKQRFEDSLDDCGRYYLGDFQTRKSDLRPTITIYGNPVCEVDYKNCQPRMLAAMSGIDLPKDFDCYSIEGLDRDFAKSLLFPILFSCSRKDAKTSITLKLKKEGITHLNSEDVLRMFEEHNAFMKDYFYNKTLYKKLQNNDSRMMRYIVEHFMKKGVVVLGYHDSVVIESKYCEELQVVMREAWVYVLGTDASCNTNIEFCN